MKKLGVILSGLAVVCCGVGSLLTTPVYADVCDDAKKNKDETMYSVLGCDTKQTIGGVGNTWISLVLSFVGLAAVITMIIGGISYVKSMGDPGKTVKARNTIIYGAVGLAVALLAYAIVALITANVETPNGL